MSLIDKKNKGGNTLVMLDVVPKKTVSVSDYDVTTYFQLTLYPVLICAGSIIK